MDKGYDRIGLTTGAQQAERYKLTNEVDEINVIGRTDARTGEKSRQVALDLKSGGSYKLGVNNEGIIDNVNMLEINNLQGKKLADVVGKEVAKKIMEIKWNLLEKLSWGKTPRMPWRTSSGKRLEKQ